jgi:PRTRC genetic system protein F
MFFDPRQSGTGVALDGTQWQPPRRAVTRRRPAHDFLTLPDVSRVVPARPSIRWPLDPAVATLAGDHFASGPLRASDVKEFSGAGHAMGQALFRWIERQTASLKRLCFRPYLLDAQAVKDQILYQENSSEFEVTSPLYLGIETPEDLVYVIGERSSALMQAHPRLLASALVLINRASFRTLYMRTPDDLLAMFAQWHWDGDPSCNDEDAVDALKDRFGDEPENYQHYLPSVVREELCPDSMLVGRYDVRHHKWRSHPSLGIEALRRLRWTQKGWVRDLCEELEHLVLLLAQAGRKQLFEWSFRPEAIYAATTIAAQGDSYTADVLDTHYEYFNSGGDGSLFHGFIPLATSPDDIRRQYADLALGFSILRRVDRVVSLITRGA